LKLDTEEKKTAFLFGYVQALAELHAEEFKRDVEGVKRELLQGAIKKVKSHRSAKEGGPK